jgi:hypothetical protein
LAGKYLSHKSLIEDYERSREEIYSLAANEIEAEISMAKALGYYIHHKPGSMKKALGGACRLENKTTCDDLANIKKVHEYDFGISSFEQAPVHHRYAWRPKSGPGAII